MAKTRDIVDAKSGRVLLAGVRWCDSFATKLRGFMFKGSLAEDEALVLVEKKDNRVNSSIHMLFVNFPLGIVWVNDAGEIVETLVARPWRLSYVPTRPVRYTLECHPDILKRFRVGDRVTFR